MLHLHIHINMPGSAWYDDEKTCQDIQLGVQAASSASSFLICGSDRRDVVKNPIWKSQHFVTASLLRQCRRMQNVVRNVLVSF